MEQSDEFGGMRDVRPVDGTGPISALPEESIEALVSAAAREIEPQPTVQADESDEPQVLQGYGPSKLPSGSTCEICGSEQAAIRINVDGNTLLMESCDGCDIRRWQLAGERIDLQEALNQVGEHSGRRR